MYVLPEPGGPINATRARGLSDLSSLIKNASGSLGWARSTFSIIVVKRFYFFEFVLDFKLRHTTNLYVMLICVNWITGRDL